MQRFFNPELMTTMAFAAYRSRFLFVYVIVGVLSLCAEFVVYRGLERLGLDYPYCAFAGVLSGILLAYCGNVRFTFKVPVAKRQRALFYFTAISVLSWAVQFQLRRRIPDWSYEQSRLAISACAFFLAYLLHRRFSFSDFKRVGVAVYANGIEDIRAIHDRIEDFGDVIHVDLVDSSYGQQDHEVATYRLEVVRAYWPRKPIHLHVMSRTPSRYLLDCFPHVDRVYVHLEIDEDIDAVLRIIRDAGKEAGIAILADTPLETARHLLERVDGVLLLAILKPGSSGQSFQMSTLQRITDLSRWPGRSRFDVCVDGGVSEANIGLLNVEIVVSGSSVLGSAAPRRQIMRLQTSCNYEQI